tara:strand:+ start:524 stop:1015 length:492 start_codon:yes stop_codon:yes gene_type:complete
MRQEIIFDFNKDSNIKDWRVVNDGVMGGLSQGEFDLSADGHGIFYGHVSTKNNGGFSMVRYPIQEIKSDKSSKIILKIKGDGKKYQLRIKNNQSNFYSYITTFKTSGEWEEIVIPVKEMFPSFRGRKLNQANFSHEKIEEIAFLIANKKEENFRLLIDSIGLK